MELLVSDEVAAVLGQPTIDTLRKRLSSNTPCMDCGEALGVGPVAVVGQQHERRALVVGTHPGCRGSEWRHVDHSLQLPVADDVASATALPSLPGSGWRRLHARLTGPKGFVPGLLVRPSVGWAWVEVVGDGETINDDLAIYRDTLGLGPPDDGDEVDLADSLAWLDEDGHLVALIKGHRIRTHAPVEDGRVIEALHQVGYVAVLVATELGDGPDQPVYGQDVIDALADGRAVTGRVPFAETAPEISTMPDTTGPVAQGIAVDDRTREELGPAVLPELARSIWAVDCQTCGQKLSAEPPPAAYIAVTGTFGVASLHHRVCQEPDWNDRNATVSVLPTASFITRLVTIAIRNGDDDELRPLPVMLVNPTLEAAFLHRTFSGQWEVGFSGEFTSIGFDPTGFDPDNPIEGAELAVTADEVAVTLSTPVGTRIWGVPVSSAPVDQYGSDLIRTLGGLVVGITHTLHPGMISSMDEVLQALHHQEVASGWVSLSN